MMIRSHVTAMGKLLPNAQLRIKRQHNEVQMTAELNFRSLFNSTYWLPDTRASNELGELYSVIQGQLDDVIIGMHNELRSNRVNQFTQHADNNIT